MIVILARPKNACLGLSALNHVREKYPFQVESLSYISGVFLHEAYAALKNLRAQNSTIQKLNAPRRNLGQSYGLGISQLVGGKEWQK